MLLTKNRLDNLPLEFRKYFWDVVFEELSFEKHSRFIAERLLNYGDMSAIKWLLSHVDKQYIQILVEKSRNLNAKTKNYWKIVFTQPPQ